MKWCRCPKCGHKLFMYDPDWTPAEYAQAVINIKCSSCKRIIDVEIADGSDLSHESKT